MFTIDKLHERIKKTRIERRLSQERVAEFVGVSRNAIVSIEAGKRKVSAEELGRFSELFNISADELLKGNSIEGNMQVFAKNFAQLKEQDRQEILALINMKRSMRN